MINSLEKAILVAGGAGFIGTNLIKRLLDLCEEKIIVVDNLRLGREANIINHEKVIFYKIDLSNEKEVKEFFNGK